MGKVKKHKTIKQPIVLMIVILLTTTCLSCTRSNPHFTKSQQKWLTENQNNVVVMGVPEGQIMGEFARELALKIETDLGLTIKNVQNPHRINTKELREGNVDLILGLNQTSIRNKTLLFTETLVQYPYMCFCASDKPIETLEDLRGNRIGFVRGSEAIHVFSTKYPLLGSKCVYYETVQEATKALKNGDVKSIILDCNGATFINSTLSNSYRLDNIQKQVQIAAYKENSILYDLINHEINKLIKQGWTEKTYQEALLNYQKQSLNLTKSEQAYLDEIEVLNVSTTLEYKPLYTVEQYTGEYGINIEILQQLSQLLDIPIEYGQIKGVDIEQALNDRTVDMTIGMYDGQPVYKILPTNPILEQSYVVIGKSKSQSVKSIYDLAPFKLAVLDNGSIGSQIENEMYNTVIKRYLQPDDVYKSVRREQADYGVLPEVVVESQLDDISYYDLGIKGSFDQANIVFFLKDSNAMLLNIINKSLNVLDTQQATERAISSLPKTVSKMTNLYMMLIILSIALISFLIVFIINRKQRLQQEKQQMEQLAYYDGLTGLYNKRGIECWFKQTKHSHKNMEIAALSFDLDNFKKVNDRYGHSAGDEILISVAKKIQEIYSQDAVCARLSGDEFLLLIKKCNSNKAEQEAICMIEYLLKNVCYRDIKPNIELSIGIVMLPKHTSNFEMMLAYGDVAMYKAKRFKKGSYVMFEPSMYEEHQEYIKVYSQVKEAFSNKEFDVWYQPIHIMKSNRLCSAEALIRWKTNKGENIGPNVFLPIIRRLRLMNQLDYYVLEKACQTAKQLQEEEQCYYPVSVNLSMQSVRDPHLVAKVEEILKQTKLDPEYLILELTEQESIVNLVKIKNTFLALKGLGVSIALDDFGDGYSNFDCLIELPIDIIKIDKGITDKLCKSSRNVKIVKAICELADSLTMTTVIEGIEEEQQLNQLQSMALDNVMIQGFLYSKPLSKEAFIDQLRNSNREVKAH